MAPEMPNNTLVYFFDGASRKLQNGKSASYGALLRLNGVAIARYAVYVGDHTNNEAEYAGALAVLRHALSMRCARVCIYGDSKLVVSQLNGTWKCKANNLKASYEDGLELMRQLHTMCEAGRLFFGHVYREFNVDADSLANVAIDRRSVGNNVVVCDSWHGTNIQFT